MTILWNRNHIHTGPVEATSPPHLYNTNIHFFHNNRGKVGGG